MRASNRLFPLILMGSLALISYWLSKMADQPAPLADARKRHAADYFIDNFMARQYDTQGQLQYTLTATRLVHFPDTDSAQIVAPRLVLHRLPQATVSADTAEYEHPSGRLILNQEVHAVRAAYATQPAIELVGETLEILTNEEEAHTSSPVRISYGLSQLHGNGMDIFYAKQLYVLRNGVTGTIHSVARPR